MTVPSELVVAVVDELEARAGRRARLTGAHHAHQTAAPGSRERRRAAVALIAVYLQAHEPLPARHGDVEAAA